VWLAGGVGIGQSSPLGARNGAFRPNFGVLNGFYLVALLLGERNLAFFRFGLDNGCPTWLGWSGGQN